MICKCGSSDKCGQATHCVRLAKMSGSRAVDAGNLVTGICVTVVTDSSTCTTCIHTYSLMTCQLATGFSGCGHPALFRAHSHALSFVDTVQHQTSHATANISEPKA